MIELFKGYLDKGWHKGKDCLDWYECEYQTKLSDRAFRKNIERFNEKYVGGQTEMFVAHSKEGYILTSDKVLITRSLCDDYKRAIKLLKKYYGCKKALSEKDQLTLEETDQDLYEIISRMGDE